MPNSQFAPWTLPSVHHHPKGVKNTVAKFLLGKCSSGRFRKVCTLFATQSKKVSLFELSKLWQNPNFTSLTPKFFLTIFLMKSKLSTAKKSKTPQHFHQFFTPKIDNCLGKSKLNFWIKNEDFEQCGSTFNIAELYWIMHVTKDI